MSTNSINGFISQNYDIVYKGDNINEEVTNANIFLLADTHGNPVFSKMNSLFINTFSKEGDYILIEGSPSMKEIDSMSTAMSVRLKSPAKIFGWDFGTTKKMFGEKWAREDLVPLQIEKEMILSKIPDTPKEEDKAKLTERYKEISLIMIKEALNARLLEYNPTQHFESRTQAMMTSIEKSSAEGRNVFVIAGECHLSKEAAAFLAGEHALTHFYEFLSSRHVVILTVKEKQGLELAREELAFIQEVQTATIAQMFGLPTEE